MQLFSKFQLTAAILAGGKSSRIKKPKCLISLERERLIEIIIKKLDKLFEEIFIVTNFPELYFPQGINLLGDLFPFRGPMAGIQVALRNSKFSVFAFACDMPFVEERVIFEIAEKHFQHKSPITVCSYEGKLYPLPGIYSKSVLPYIENLLAEDKLSMTKLIHSFKSQIIEVENLDIKGLSFININTQEDLEKIKQGGIKCSG